MRHPRILAVILPLLLLAPTANAFGQLRVAVTGGLDFATRTEESSNYAWDRISDTYYSTGFSAGLSGIVPLPGALDLELRSVYSRRGGSFSSVWLDTHFREEWLYESRISGNHLRLATLGRVDLPLTRNGLRAYLATGPVLSWEISCNEEETAFAWPLSPGDAGRTTTHECATDRDKFDLGAAGELGFEYRVTGTMGITMGTVYAFGLRNLAKARGERRGDSKRRQSVTIRTGIVYGIG